MPPLTSCGEADLGADDEPCSTPLIESGIDDLQHASGGFSGPEPADVRQEPRLAALQDQVGIDNRPAGATPDHRVETGALARPRHDHEGGRLNATACRQHSH